MYSFTALLNSASERYFLRYNSSLLKFAKKRLYDRIVVSSVSADTIDDFDEERAQSLMREKNELQNKLEELYGNKARKEAVQSRLQDVYAIMDGLKNHQIVYNDELVRQIIEVVIVESKEKIKIIFKGGLKVEENL